MVNSEHIPVLPRASLTVLNPDFTGVIQTSVWAPPPPPPWKVSRATALVLYFRPGDLLYPLFISDWIFVNRKQCICLYSIVFLDCFALTEEEKT